MKNKLYYLWKAIGPVILSVLSFFISFTIITNSFSGSFNLLANRGFGKITFSLMAIYQIFLFVSILSKEFCTKFLNDTIFWFKNVKVFKSFGLFFSIFFIAHSIILVVFYISGFAYQIHNWGYFTPSLILKILFGFFVAFLLAWSEELIFRGLLYSYFAQFFIPLTSIFVTSLIFMLVHNLKNPILLISSEWKLGLGLFLLGILLNLIYVTSGKLYNSIAAHMGLVAVKVFLRRAPIIKFIPQEKLPFWAHSDLRQSLLIQLLFILVIFLLIFLNKKQLLQKKKIVF